MQIGSFNRRVAIQRFDSGEDEFGQQVLTWVDVAKVWAAIPTPDGKEIISGARDVSEVISKMRIRYRKDITPAMRILLGGVIYNIQAVLPDEAGRKYVDLLVMQGANDG